MTSIMAVGETTESGALSAVTAEVMAAARKLAPRNNVSLALLGDDLGTARQEAAASGAGRIYLLEHPSLAMGATGGFDAAVAAMAVLCERAAPQIVLFSNTDFGANVGPRLAFRTGGVAARDCIDLAIDTGSQRLLATRPVHGGNATAVVEFATASPWIATLRLKAFDPLPPEGAGEAEVETIPLDDAIGVSSVRLLDTVREDRAGVRLEEAEVVVAGGRGLGGPAPFEQLSELAALLGGAVGASRAACDAGWMDHSHQIGLTGKSISPRLYITVGVSGASQHMAGCSGARNIVAINSDPNASIFKEARYGVAGDWQQVLPALIATLRDLS